MKIVKETSKLIFMFFASGAIAGNAIAGPCGGAKPAKVARYKTPQMVTFVNSTIDFLNSEENANQRHLMVLQKCQRIFNSGQSTAKGMDAKSLKTCKNLSNRGGYNLQKVAIKVPEDQIKNVEQLTAIKEISKKKAEKVVKKDNLTTTNNSELLLF
tara:strand:- start:296 stop:763 length:468 start_codon:yes stop_codon:yes gene_type:complete